MMKPINECQRGGEASQRVALLTKLRRERNCDIKNDCRG